MPKRMHRNLKRTARKKFGSTSSKRAKRYIYGTINKYRKRKRSRR